jgi:triacylglycerol esterase/lipase EstA (alpha/beta hydrolase family)
MKHIVVLVHGFQASRQDFILLKNCLEIVYGIHVIISTCNEGLTENSIIVAGKRLALELKKILCHQISEYKLSFIGHSMGGLIIRSAIPELM